MRREFVFLISMCTLSLMGLGAMAREYSSGEERWCAAFLAAPIAVNDENYGQEDLPQTGDVSENDYDPDGDPLTYTVIVEPLHGDLTMQPDGQYVYQPELEYNGFDYATYQVCDPGGACATAVIEFAMTFVNDNPFVFDETFMVSMNQPFSGSVAANDYDVDIEPLFYHLLVPPSNVTGLSFNLQGTVAFTPASGFTGTLTLLYQACDPCGACKLATATFNVVQNDPPVANNDYHFTSLNTPLDLTVAQNDSDPNGDQLTYSLVDEPSYGTLEMDADGHYLYTPIPFFSGFDYITYQACDPFGACDQAVLEIEVVFVNVTPVAEDDLASCSEDMVCSGSVATNDYDPNVEVLTYLLMAGPAVGVLNWNSLTGDFTYTPPANYSGSVQVVYTACDPCNACDVGVLTIQVNAVNDPPLAQNDSASGTEELQISGNVSVNDSDVEGGQLVFSVVNTSLHGVLSLLPNGNFTYLPQLNYSGTDGFSYQVCDPQGACSIATVELFLAPVNDLPVVQNDQFTLNEDVQLNGSVVLNDSDVETANLSCSLVSQVSHGSLVFNVSGVFTYTPALNYYGSDSFVYEACDGEGSCAQATVSIQINPVNDAPVAFNDIASGTSNVVISGDVSANDSDPEGGALNFSLFTPSEAGIAEVSANGVFTYTPQANFTGSDSFIYQVCDPAGACVTAIVTVNVSAPDNTAPVAGDDQFVVNEDTDLMDNVGANDTDAEPGLLAFALLSQTLNGTLEFYPSGMFTYTPGLNFSGQDSFEYQACDSQGACAQATVTIQVSAVNDAPVAQADNSSGQEDQVINGNVSINDSDVEAGLLTYSLYTAPDFGEVVLLANGSFAYTPEMNFNGSDSFVYQVCDAQGACSSATVGLIVTGVNDSPEAGSDQFETLEDTALDGDVSGNDTDIEPGLLTFSLLTGPTNGDLIFAAQGSFSYTPESHVFGTDSFTYEVCDGQGLCDQATVSIQVVGVNDAPVAVNDEAWGTQNQAFSGTVAGNDSDVDGGVLSYSVASSPVFGVVNMTSSGSFNFTPQQGYYGVDSFTYQVCDDGGLCDLATVTLNISQLVNTPPVGNDDNYQVNEDVVLNGNVRNNDTDAQPGPLTCTVLIPPSNGVLILYQQGGFSYTPALNFNGTDSFVYNVCDNGGLCDQAVVTILVKWINDLPVANNDSFTTDEDTSISASVTGNDSDVDIEPLYYSVLTAPAQGAFSLEENGEFSYTPLLDFIGTVSFVYLTCDSCNACDAATVSIHVQAVNDAPLAQGESVVLDEDQVITGTLAGNDFDVDDAVLFYSVVNDDSHGVFTLNANGTYSFTPDHNYFGSGLVVYRVCDNDGACAEAELDIDVLPLNDSPLAEADYFDTTEDEELTGSAAGNDTDVEGDFLIYSLVSGPSNGQFEMAEDGSFIYIPLLNFFGADEVVYRVCDTNGACTDGTLLVQVYFVNDLPDAIDDYIYPAMNQQYSGTLSDNDVEVDPELLDYSIVQDAASGVFALNPDGTYTYTPNDGYTGEDEVWYSACDPCGACDMAVLYITVGAVNTPPLAGEVAQQMCEGNSWQFDLDAVVSDQEDPNSGLQIDIVSFSAGVWTIDPVTHLAEFNPPVDFSGNAALVFRVCDSWGGSLCSEGNISIDVIPVSSPVLTSVTITDVSCFGESDGAVTLETDGIADQFLWNGGGESAELSGLPAGEYTVTVSRSGFCAPSAQFSFEVAEPDELSVSGLIADPIDETPGGVSGGIAEGGTPPYAYQWIFVPSGEVVSGTLSLGDLISAGQAGEYQLLITDAHGCQISESLLITGLETEEDGFSMAVFPNPAHSEISLILSGNFGGNADISVYDISGKLVYALNRQLLAGGSRLIIPLDPLASGLYTIRVSGEDRSVTRVFQKY